MWGRRAGGGESSAESHEATQHVSFGDGVVRLSETAREVCEILTSTVFPAEFKDWVAPVLVEEIVPHLEYHIERQELYRSGALTKGKASPQARQKMLELATHVVENLYGIAENTLSPDEWPDPLQETASLSSDGGTERIFTQNSADFPSELR